MDLDGVVYRGRDPVPGAAEFIDRWRGRGVRFAFLTNRSGRAPLEVAGHLRSLGIPCQPDEVLTSATATARHLGKGSVYAIGGEGLRAALRQHGLTLTDSEPDYVVVGGDSSITYDKLVIAVRLIRNGARFVATNADRLVNTQTGVVPANGAIVQALAYATGIQPMIVGKPEPIMIRQAIELLAVSKGEVILIGDNLETDIEAGRRAGIRTVHLLTGISSGPQVTLRGYQELEDHLSSLRDDDRN